ncbi:YqcC family protein [Thalassotalea aquiviva]|uniref:YqcC family protein n=1 Tax=Thalassotalea aquiviva TaxID=3242415 RepID=UPI00352B3337
MQKPQTIMTLLNALEQELKNLGLWQQEGIDEDLLQSTQPFCIDTLSFEQWLQFVFLTKMHQMIEANQALPNNIAICPMAEESFKSLGQNASDLINIIGDIDQCLSGKREQTLYVRPAK